MNRAAMLVLAPMSGLYGLAMKSRRALYRQRILSTHELGVPVISVGNLTTGGTGKTPLVEWIARHLAKQLRRVCILTRGYGRANERDRVVVSDGNEILATPELAGDEPFLLAEKLLNEAAVIGDADREAAARWALANLRSDVFLLDDGFQNLRIARNLDLVTIDATNPWGNGWLLPVGSLREPLAELSRTDCVVVTRAAGHAQAEELKKQIASFTDKPVFVSRMTASDARPAQTCGNDNRQPPTTEELRKTRVAAFCGIGNPQAFFSDLSALGYHLVHTEAFPDHHWYKKSDIDRLSRESSEKGATALLTTAKDEVKLRSLTFKLPCYVIDIATKIDNASQLTELIDDALAS